jgi:hypothetical protein
VLPRLDVWRGGQPTVRFDSTSPPAGSIQTRRSVGQQQNNGTYASKSPSANTVRTNTSQSNSHRVVQVNRLAADAEAVAYNAPAETLPDGTPLHYRQPYANSGKPAEEAARDAARLESNAYFFSPDLGLAVTPPRECDSLRWWASAKIAWPLTGRCAGRQIGVKTLLLAAIGSFMTKAEPLRKLWII